MTGGQTGALRAEGRTLQQIAGKLNEDRHTTRLGKGWSPTQVHRILKRTAPAS